jgi:hypothetical protein
MNLQDLVNGLQKSENVPSHEHSRDAVLGNLMNQKVP